jgi:hypothetical protein
MGAMQIMYAISLIGIVTTNPPLYNEYILIKFIIKKMHISEFSNCWVVLVSARGMAIHWSQTKRNLLLEIVYWARQPRIKSSVSYRATPAVTKIT